MSEHSSYIQNSLTTSASKEVVLAIQNLSFAYALTLDRNVVEDFSCEVCAGQKDSRPAAIPESARLIAVTSRAAILLQIGTQASSKYLRAQDPR